MRRLVAWAVHAGRGRWLALILLATVSLPVAVHQYSPFGRARIALFDLYQKELPRPRLSGPAVIVGIDEAALQGIGQWPWPRTKLAELIDLIGTQGALAIGLDMLLPQRDQTSPESVAERLGPEHELIRDELLKVTANDTVLSESLQRHRVVLGAVGLDHLDLRAGAKPRASEDDQLEGPRVLRLWPITARGDDFVSRVRQFSHVEPSLPQLQAVAAGQGLLNAGERGTVRGVHAISVVGKTLDLVPAFALELLRVASGASGVQVESDRGGVSAVRIDDLRVPTQPDGSVLLHFSTLHPERYVSALDVFKLATAPVTFKDKIVIIAQTSAGIDSKATPRGELVFGADVHAQLIESFFDQRFLQRPRWMPWAEVSTLLVLGGLLIWVAPRLGRDPTILLAFGVLALVVAVGFGLFHWQGLLFDAFSLVIALTTVFSSLIASALVRADHERRVTDQKLREASETAARVDGELKAAQRIQLGILPSSAASFPGETRFDLAAAIEPARTVGGDLYDFFMLDSRRLFLLIGDVSGKGVPASLLMSIAKAITKSIALRAQGDVTQVLTQANIEVSRDNPESQFITGFAAVLDVESGWLRYWTAGHDTPFLRDGSGVRQIDRALSGPPLCVLDGFEYREQQLSLEPADVLVLFTDGLTEAENAAGVQFGKVRLAQCIDALPSEMPAAKILESVRHSVGEFLDGTQASDDLTMVVVRWLGGTNQPGAHDSPSRPVS